MRPGREREEVVLRSGGGTREGQERKEHGSTFLQFILLFLNTEKFLNLPPLPLHVQL